MTTPGSLTFSPFSTVRKVSNHNTDITLRFGGKTPVRFVHDAGALAVQTVSRTLCATDLEKFDKVVKKSAPDDRDMTPPVVCARTG